VRPEVAGGIDRTLTRLYISGHPKTRGQRSRELDEYFPEQLSMKYFAAILTIGDSSRSQEYRPHHLAFLERGEREGFIFARGRFSDGAGGLIIYRADSLEEAGRLAGQDPYVASGVRRLELHEWDVLLAK
jgi:uncharacterized protein YciI